MKTSELIGDDLNRAVAMALGYKLCLMPAWNKAGQRVADVWEIVFEDDAEYTETIPDYATDITAAWPIIVEHGISLSFFDDEDSPPWDAYMQMRPSLGSIEGFDPLVLAMQMFVTSKLGAEVTLP